MTDSGKQRQEVSGAAESRRTFIKSLVAAIGGIATLNTWGATAAGLPWRRTIFCQFAGQEKHKELLSALAGCARETDCEIVIGVDGHPDIFAYGCFIQIIDRNSVGEEMWRDYATAYKDAGDIVPCFIIDDRKDLFLPNWKFVRQIDLRDPGSVGMIVDTIKQMKAEMNRRLPAIFNTTTHVCGAPASKPSSSPFAKGGKRGFGLENRSFF